MDVELLDTAASAIWMAVGASLVGLAVSAIHRGASVLLAQESRIRNASLRDALQFATAQAESAADTIVTGLNQTVVAQLKAEGKWDSATAAATKKQAMQLLERTLSADAKAALARGGTDLNAYLSSVVEAKVATAPNRALRRQATAG